MLFRSALIHPRRAKLLPGPRDSPFVPMIVYTRREKADAAAAAVDGPQAAAAADAVADERIANM